MLAFLITHVGSPADAYALMHDVLNTNYNYTNNKHNNDRVCIVNTNNNNSKLVNKNIKLNILPSIKHMFYANTTFYAYRR